MAPNADAMCESLARLIGRQLQIDIEWIDDVPWDEREQMLDAGDLDLCWICGLPYIEKVDRGNALVALVAPVMQHARYLDQPVYYSDVVVRADSPYLAFHDLRDKPWAFNEPNSHSGFNVVRYHLAAQGLNFDFFETMVQAGSHQSALDLILAGAVAGGAIDSSVLEAEGRRRADLEAQIRVVDTLGPSPAPPWVASTRLAASFRARLSDLLASIHRTAEGRSILGSWGIARLQPVTRQTYEPIRRMSLLGLSMVAGNSSLA